MSERSPFESAFALHTAGRLGDAEIAYRQLLATNPQHVEAQHYLGVLLHQLGRSQEGVSLIQGALEADGGSAPRYNDLGNIFSHTENLPSAAAAFIASLELNVDDANVWNNLGSVLHRQQDLDNAESAYRNALALDGDHMPAINNLAALLEGRGQDEESSLLWCRAYILQSSADKSPKLLGIAYYRLGRIAEAAECYRKWLSVEPDNAHARHHLAACTGEDVPVRASDGFITALFNGMSESFDEKLTGKLSYRGPEIIAELLGGYAVANGELDILDGGCGTGLCAPVLAPYARHLTGVDLSVGMLTKAKERDLYDELVEAELSSYLLKREDAFDLIVMADTLIYFGDLRALFAATRQALRAGGAFAFTVEEAVETGQQTDYRLIPSGRYSHSSRYLDQMLDAAGFEILRIDAVTLRNEFCKPTQGLGVLARVLPR